MIVPIQPRNQNWDNYIVCPSLPLTVENYREQMLERAKVTEGTYAFNLVSDLHEAIFVKSIDMKSDYVDYFGLEYDSFYRYLLRRTRLPKSVAKRLAGLFERSLGIYYLKPDNHYIYGIANEDMLRCLIETDEPEGEP